MPDHETITTPEDPNHCFRCDAERSGHSYMLLFGKWNPDREGFDRAPVVRPFCESCYREHMDRTVGAHWRVEDGETLWDVLEASQGELVADLKPCFVGGRPFVRVVDGELRGITMQHYPLPEDHEADIGFKPERLDDVDREWLTGIIDEDAALPDSEFPTIAIIRPIEETPFGDIRAQGGNSRKLQEYAHVRD